MEVLNLEAESNNPNLDGDFKSVLEILKKRRERPNNNNSDSIPSSLKLDIDNIKEEDEKSVASVDQESRPVDDHSSPPSSELSSVYSSLLSAIDQDDVERCRAVCMELHQRDKTLGDPEMRDPDSGATALHLALDRKATRVAAFFIQYSNEEFLVEECEVIIKNVHSKKTCLHYLTELGDYKLFLAFLDKIPKGRLKDEFLRKTVLTEMQGQRPRHLSAIHLASLYGQMDIVDMLISLGVDVNTTNNKNDTPVLWAARSNNIAMTRKLISYKADLNLANDKGSTPLYFAVRYGYPELVKVLLEEGDCDVNQRRKLGLVLPVVLASTLGFADIVDILLGHGANPKAEINGGQTPLHYAAAMGNEDVVEILLHNGVHVDDPDDMGNTALMIAVRAGNLNVVRQLLAGHCNISAKNKFGETIWDFAVAQQDENLLRQIIKLYRQFRRMTGRRTIFPVGKSPLHVAALKGDIDKIRNLFELGVDAKSEDHGGNTFIHYAARENSTSVLEQFLSDADAEQRNADDDTPLHIAIKNGHEESTDILLKKSKMTCKNNNGYTPLHMSCSSPASTAMIVNRLVEVMVKTNSWSLVDEKDNYGNTALHIAAKRGRVDLIQELAPLNPMVKNKDGDSPLHIAAKGGHYQTLEELLDVFNKPGKGLQMDHQNEEGETLLHICTKNGNAEMVEMLIAAGCDLAVRNKEGNTVLHELIEQSMLEPAIREQLIDVFNCITNNAVLWWCMKNEHHMPEEGSEPYLDMKRDAMLNLTSEIYNFQAMNAVVFGASIGATTILRCVFNLRGVYKFVDNKKITYDITNVAPETVPERVKAKKISHYTARTAIGALDDEHVDERENIGYESCLDIVTNLENEILATQVLDVSPIKQLVANYWRAYQWIYGLLMVIHIVYMSFFTTYAIRNLSPLEINGTTVRVKDTGMALFLIWPAMLIIFEVYYLVTSIIRFVSRRQKRKMFEKDKEPFRCRLGSPLQIPLRFLTFLINYLTHIALLSFCGLIVAWFVMFQLDVGNATSYVVAIVMILGWLFTITFTKGFETVHAFSIMLKYIILRDISRFLVIYVFILLAFALALHASIQIVPDVAIGYASIWDSLFMTFNMMLGMDDLFGGEYEDGFSAAGVSPIFSKLIYLTYLILSTIILLNLLVAMMSDTYIDIKSREGTTWRIGSVRLALQIERKMPFLKRFFKFIGIIPARINVDPDTNRFMMTLLSSEVRSEQEVVKDELSEFMVRLDTKLDVMRGQYAQLAEQVEEIAVKQEHLFQGDRRGRPGSGARAKRVSQSRKMSSMALLGDKKLSVSSTPRMLSTRR